MILDDFRYKLIEPLFEEIVNYKKLKLNCDFRDYIKTSSNIKNSCSRELIVYVNARKKDKITFSEIINKIIYKYSLKQIQKNYELFKYQNNEVDNKNYSINQANISNEFKELFVNFFYEKFFDYEKICELIDSEKYSKTKFNRKVFHRIYYL